MQSVLSNQNVALPTGFAKPKKFVNPPTSITFWGEQEEWDSFLSPAQVEIWGSERYPEHPMNAVFQLYLEQVEFVKNDEDDEEREYTIEKQVAGMGYMSFYDEKDMLDQIVYCKNGCWKLKGEKRARDLDGDLCVTDDDDDDEDEQMDVCGYTECDTLIPEYLDEETGDLIDGRDEYCSDTCREAQQKEDWYTAEDPEK